MILCFDIGGTTIKVAEAYSAENVVPKGRIATPTDDFDGFVAVLQTAIDSATIRPQVLAFSMAGVIDSDSGIATAANIPCLTGRRLQIDFETILGLPVVLANDADCFALAEATVGAGRGHDVVFGLILGTGVGGGVVVHGQLINGAGGFAGELGHGSIAQRVFDDPAVTLPAFACGCGQTGCLDAVCSARGIEKLHLHLHDVRMDSRAIVAGWERGDAIAAKTVEVWLALLSGPLAVMENMLGAGVIAIGGGMSNSSRLIAALDIAVREKCLKRFARSLVVPAECPIEPGLVGAAILGLQRHGASAL
ncbi:ROK family protein [Pacificibacter marinus]|uniref:N-acetylglucosamine kinase n=1 Tax=Pacificibacter marinus TaxID=658057 RepID=A0A1Y5R7J7_9RHOB|nr:ROK family protein [Pacificibacter marinus]SEK28581.1 N-acetylglucosamine kinase [Pacificibacter marinus]SLN11001.1 N-acetyl-D-glucosamine kinase [Pacificibacter marinus]